MPVDLSSYKVANQELSSSTKFDNLVQAVQDALNALPPAQIVGYPSDAAKFLRGDGAWAAVGVGYGTSLPGSPTDGQQFVLVDSTTAPTYQWLFRYNNGATTNKWEFIGGAPKAIQVASGESTASTTYVALTTAQSFTIPVTGIYLARLVVGFVNSADNPGGPRGAIIWNGTTVAEGEGRTFNGTGPGFSVEYTASITATQVAEAKYKAQTSSTTFGHRMFSIIPLRIGG